jgi:hypothetical protein
MTSFIASLGRLFFAAVLIVPALSLSAQHRTTRPPVPEEPIGAIIAAFQTHSIVALSDAHGNEQNQAFRLSLIRDPRFAATVNDIVVELGNARYQDVMDRYILGDDIPYAALRRAWQDTTVPTAGNNYTMMQQLVEAVRDVNRSLPRSRQLRILLGDPPIDWDQVHTHDEHWKWIEMRDTFPAALIQVEVLAKRRRALLLYGSMHFQRRNLFSNYEMEKWQAQTIVSLLERSIPITVFTIWQQSLDNLPVDATSWPVPSLAIIRGTTLGAADFALYHPAPPTRFAVVDGKFVPIPREQWRSLRAEDQLDAVLYLGPSGTMRNRQSHEIPVALCSEPGFLDTQLKRLALSRVPQFEANRLKQYCARVTQR